MSGQNLTIDTLLDTACGAAERCHAVCSRQFWGALPTTYTYTSHSEAQINHHSKDFLLALHQTMDYGIVKREAILDRSYFI